MPTAVILPIIPVDKASGNPFKDKRQVFLAFLKQNMYVISHQAICVNCISALFPVLGQRFQKMLPVFIILKYLLSVYAPEHDVVNPTFCLFSCLS